jgi:hypothetical protein
MCEDFAPNLGDKRTGCCITTTYCLTLPFLPKQYSDILTSYIRERIFTVKFENECSGSKQIKAGVPQGSVLGPILYLLYTSDIQITEDTLLATFADDTKRYRL